jgi:transcriptional regulator with XRE-family HTH domain
MSLGQRIARLRQERNQTLQDVADGAELTPSFLSRLERDQVNISVANLRKLAQFFGVPMTYFFEGEDRGPAAIVTRAGERPRLSQPRAAAQIHALTQAHASMGARLLDASPGAAGVDEGERLLFVLEGQLRCQVADDVYMLEAGDTLWVRRAAQVHWENSEGEPATVLIIQPAREAP